MHSPVNRIGRHDALDRPDLLRDRDQCADCRACQDGEHQRGPGLALGKGVAASGVHGRASPGDVTRGGWYVSCRPNPDNPATRPGWTQAVDVGR